MNILLLGKQGQVGRALEKSLLPLGTVTSLGRSEVNLEDLDQLQQTLSTYAPDIIVNAAAYTAVDKAESETDIAFKVNAHAVESMAHYARDKAALLVHYSTDYVFDGSQLNSYQETDLTHPLNIYGHSKLAGEQSILQSGCRAFIFRTSWVFSSHGHNFIKTVLRLGQERDSLQMINDQYGAPTSATLIANTTARALMAHQHQRLAEGIYHLTAQGETTWHGLASFVMQRAQHLGIEMKLSPEFIEAIATTAYPTPATRPKNSRLNTTKLSHALNITLPYWQEDVTLVVDELLQQEVCA